MEGDGLRLVELMAALSLATDLGTGQPMEHALRTAVLAVRAAGALGLSPADRSVILYTALLRFVGCTSDASETAVLAGGDEIAFNQAMAPVVMADDREAVPHLVRHLGEGLPLARRAGRVASALSDPGAKRRSLSGHCEVAARLATRIGLPAEVTAALAHAYERWDGKGLPEGLAGDEVPLAIRVAVVARDVDVWSARPQLGETGAML
ncbi:MAG: LuxR family transcriptional regulator, partial [Actinomycetota bacterium]|nr:LuxR family transcriptional regulator [Actinomycetota bacterium]